MQVGGGRGSQGSWKWKARCAIRLFVYYLSCDGKEWVTTYNLLSILTKHRLEILLQLSWIILWLNGMNAPADSAPKATVPAEGRGRVIEEPLVLHWQMDGKLPAFKMFFLCNIGWVHFCTFIKAQHGGWGWQNQKEKNYNCAFSDNDTVIQPGDCFACELQNSQVGAMMHLSEKTCCPSCSRTISCSHDVKTLHRWMCKAPNPNQLGANLDPWSRSEGNRHYYYS